MERRSLVTLNALAWLAGLLYRIRILWFILVVFAIGWFVFSLVSSTGNSTQSLLALSLLLWSSLLLGAGFTLLRLPPAVLERDRWRQRLRKRLLQLAYWVAVVGFLALAGLASMMSFRALSLALV